MLENEIVKKLKSNLKIKFSNKQEIRMGSPYFIADINLDGIEVKLPKAEWQNKYAISKDKKSIVLIGFDFTNNEPGFKLYIIDVESKKITKSKRILGLINNISLEDKIIKFNKFLYDKSKSKTGELCYHIDEEFEIE